MLEKLCTICLGISVVELSMLIFIMSQCQYVTMSQCVSPFQQNFVEFGLNIYCWIADVDFYIFYKNKRFLQYCAAEWLMLILVRKQWHNIHSVSKGAAKLCKTCIGISDCWIADADNSHLWCMGCWGLKACLFGHQVKKNTKARETNCACLQCNVLFTME